MTNKKSLYVIIGIIVLIVIGGGIFFLTNKGAEKEGEVVPSSSTSITSQVPAGDTTMVDCGTAEDPSCFMGRANSCLPVKVKMIGSDNKTEIELIVLGIENDKCHFQRKLNGTLNLNCYFPKETDIWNAIDQTFGNDHGLQKVVDDACAGW